VTGKRPIATWVAAFILLLLNLAPALAYDEVKLRDAERSATLLQAQLRGVASRINAGNLPDDGLAAQRLVLEKLRAAAATGAENAAGPLNDIASQVNELGPAPTAGQQETETIAVQRKDLTTQLARATAAQKQFVLVGLEAEQTLARLTNLQRSQFLQRIFKADKSILNPTLWSSTLDGVSLLSQRVSNLFAKGLVDAGSALNFSGVLLLPIGLVSLWFLVFKLMPNVMARFSLATPGPFTESYTGLEKLWHALWSLVKYLVVIALVSLLLLATLDATGLLTAPIANLSRIGYEAIKPAFLYGGLIYFVTSPRKPEWRLLAIESTAARTLTVIVIISYLVYGLGDQISDFASSINLPVSFAVGQSAVSSLILVVLIGLGLLLVRRQALKGLAAADTPYFLTWFMNFMPLWWLLLCVAALALIFGFIALSYFISGNLLDTAMLAVFMGLLHAFTDALASAAVDPNSNVGRVLRRLTNWSDQGIQRIVLVLRTLADAILIIVSILALVALWTVVLFDVTSFMGDMGQGIKLGNITLSPKAIAIALVVFAVGTTATKYFTRWLERRVLVETHLDKGVQDSLRAAAGYGGYSLAAAIALSAAGLEFSSLALVAGALGVGIGFGLQSIVNNFVSGLILLAERPVRVGDWVVTNAGEGIVKKINVRSTEIETFDNCTIIVPNSNLISEAVRNWTHRDSVGRFGISMTFNHNTDADALAKQLMAIVQAHPKVMRHPAPLVQLSKITPLGYEFDMRGHIQDVFEAAQVTSELRIQIAGAVPKDSLSSTLPPKPPEPPPRAAKK
jgi:potassium-dependent mechanosensitive channel